MESKHLSDSLQDNVSSFKDIFDYPNNRSLVVRPLSFAAGELEGVVLYVEDAANIVVIEEEIIKSLLKAEFHSLPDEDLASYLLKGTLTASRGKLIRTFEEGVKNLIVGNTVLLIHGQEGALALETPGFESRSVATPSSENVIKGPKEAFVESLATNRSLIRKQIKDPKLIFETVNMGTKEVHQAQMIYLQHLADPELVETVRGRLKQLDAGFIQGLPMLEQFIEEKPYSLFPTTLTTERPDRTASFIWEGHVALLMENSPYAIVVPVTFWSLFQIPEDQYLRWAYGNFIRLIRMVAIFVALFMPSIYVAVSTFHEEMIQTDLLLAIAAARERVPFSVLVEVLIMEFSYELLREASIRIPTIIGPTVGIIGALILGQAAVEANIVSPILVIVVGITGLSSFIISELSLNFSIRIMRFIVLFAAATMGFLGISLVATCFLAYLLSYKSFGVPFFAPASPWVPSTGDLLFRRISKKQWLRPEHVSPQRKLKLKLRKPKGK